MLQRAFAGIAGLQSIASSIRSLHLNIQAEKHFGSNMFWDELSPARELLPCLLRSTTGAVAFAKHATP